MLSLALEIISAMLICSRRRRGPFGRAPG